MPDVERYMAAMDIFILPHRKASAWWQSAGHGRSDYRHTRAGERNGTNVTGLTVPVKDAKAIAVRLKLVEDERKRKEFGKAGHKFVKSHLMQGYSGN